MSWKTLRSRQVYDNNWMTVFEDDVVNPRGGNNRYGWVHFRNRAIAVVPIDADSSTWLVGQQRYTLGEYSWEVPMGGGALDDEPIDAAKRELKEETGLVAGRWTEIMRVTLSNSITDERGVVFVAEELTPGEPEFGATEALEIQRLPLAEAIQMALDGKISDGLSVTALLKVAVLRGYSTD